MILTRAEMIFDMRTIKYYVRYIIKKNSHLSFDYF